jgi:Bacterial capsule synthesis protein PGA_cap
VDECGIDIVYGHSSHHVQGVEIRHGSLIIYGCGDFVDDYALVPAYRNDLGAIWQVIVNSQSSAPGSQSGHSTTTRLAPERLAPERLEVFPTRIRDFQADLLHVTDPDHDFVCSKICNLSAECGTQARPERGAEGQLIFSIESTPS